MTKKRLEHNVGPGSNGPEKKSVKVLAPATIANIVCGFDVLGMALNNPQDVMEL